MKTLLKKNWSNLLLIVILIVVLIPQTRMPLQVFLQQIIAMAPSKIAEVERETITNYTWEMTTLEGSTINFSRSEGNVVLVNFWATWCPPCVAEMPSLQKLFDAYGDRVDFYLITAEKPEVAQKFLQQKGYTFPVYLETQQPPMELRTQALPTTYIFSQAGEIVVKKTGAAKWHGGKVRGIIDTLLLGPR